ncbi:MAG: lamin tail domain-containing protein [Kiritimatiellae bacterium]|nr:lamin tail domain-containing protein [Kiritimatiellia bacterium]
MIAARGERVIAAVRITELMAAPSARLLQADSNGVPRLGSGVPWMSPAFIATNWLSATGSFGFGSTVVNVNNDVADQLSGASLTMYLRGSFVVAPALLTSGGTVRLTLDYDSGFIAYLNGREVARRNLGPSNSFAYCDQPAYNWRLSGTNETYLPGAATNLLGAGTNVLAVQVHGFTNVSFKAAVSLHLLAPTGTVTLVPSNQAWRCFFGTTEPSGGIPEVAQVARTMWGLEWTLPDFPDSGWPVGPGGIGFGDGDDATDVYDQMYGKAVSLYMRRAFVVDGATAASTNLLEFQVDFDDGFVAYLNGVEIARSNLGSVGMLVPYNMPATRSREAGAPVTITVGIASNFLVAGTNLLAIQTHNTSATSSDLSMIPYLRLRGGPTLVAAGDLWRYFVGVRAPLASGDEEEGEDDPEPLEPDFADWVELYNDGTAPVSLSGWSLTDDPRAPARWTFPAGVVIPPGGYLVVLCTGRNLRDPSKTLHTSFGLSRHGEYLGLYDASGNVVSEIAPGFPPQSPFYSYGWSESHGGWRYFEVATPGEPNAGPTWPGILAPPGFVPAAGLYTNNLTVAITSAVPGATIRVTINGEEPDLTNGFAYSGPFTLTTTATLRARAFLAGWIPSPTVTRSYLVNPPALLRGSPAVLLAGPWETAWHKPNGVMAIVGGVWSGGLWNATSLDDYNIPLKRGRAYERVISIEWWDPASNAVKQTDAGVRIAGSNHARSRYELQQMTGTWYGSWTSKPQFNTYFRSMYGEEPWQISLNAPLWPVRPYESLRLRAGKNDYDRPFIRDELMRRLYADTGQPSSVGCIAALYVNGIFRCYYNPVERYDVGYLQYWHGGTGRWDIISHGGVTEGDAVALTALIQQATNSNMAVLSNYLAIVEKLDPTNLADYILANAYGATWDWPHNNYYMARERSARGRFRFYMWDAEGAFGMNFKNDIRFDILYECMTNRSTAARAAILYRALWASPEFRLLMADRIHRHFFNNGAFTTNNAMRRFLELKAEADPLIIYVRGSGITNAHMTVFTNWISYRLPHMFTQFVTNLVWPATGPPLLLTPPGIVSNGTVVQIANTNAGGAVYYTLDGTDPRAPGGAIAGTLYTNGVVLTEPARLLARVRSPGGEWSALTEGVYSTEDPPPIYITEIMYHPPGNAAWEFVELYNAGDRPVELWPLSFTAGIQFSFATGAVTRLGPRQYVLVVQDLAAFAARFNTNGLAIAGTFSGRLDNAGERLELRHAYFGAIHSFDYDDDWYPQTDGEGFSLVIRAIHADRQMWGRREGWAASAKLGGSPGGPDLGDVPPPGSVVINEVLAHTDTSPVGDWVELHNTTSSNLNLGGWWLSDSESEPFKYRIPDGTVLPAGGFLVFNTTNHFGAAGASNAFSFSEYGEKAVLSSAWDEFGNPTGYREVRSFGASDRETTFGRHVRSDGREVFVIQKWPTPGAPNAGPRVGPIVISEILYAPTGAVPEHVEFYCLAPTNVPLFDPATPTNRWRFRGAGTFVFPSGAVARAFDTFVLTGTNPAAFRAMRGLPESYPVYGPFTGRLDNAGDLLRLERPLSFDPAAQPYETVEEIEYNDKAPWPVLSGAGESLRRIRLAQFGNDPANWTAGPSGGAAGPKPREDSDGDGLPDRWEAARGRAPDRFEPPGLDRDGDGMSDTEEYLAGTDPADSNDLFRISITLSNGVPAVVFFGRAATGAGYEGLQRRYAVEGAPTGWSTGGWTAVSGAEELIGSNRWLSVPLPVVLTNGRFRIQRVRAWLEVP